MVHSSVFAAEKLAGEELWAESSIFGGKQSSSAPLCKNYYHSFNYLGVFGWKVTPITTTPAEIDIVAEQQKYPIPILGSFGYNISKRENKKKSFPVIRHTL